MVFDEDAGSLVISPPGSSGSSSSEAELPVLCVGEGKLNCKNYSLNKQSISKITSQFFFQPGSTLEIKLIVLKLPYFLVLSTIVCIKLFQTFYINLLFTIKCDLLKRLLFSCYSHLQLFVQQYLESLLSTYLQFKPNMLHV